MRYAITDIHGGNLTFQALLRKIDLRHSDRLFLLGDYVDRGPDSIGVLETICTLMSAGYDIRPLRGNHDEMLLQTVVNNNYEYSESYYQAFGKNTLFTAGINDFNSFPSKYLNLIESMPYIHVEPDYVFVHAGLNMKVSDPIKNTENIDMIWNRCNSVEIRKLGGRQLVTGHMIRMLDDIRRSICSAHICLDNGAFTRQQPEMGNLVALNLDTKELSIQPWCENK